MADTKKTFFLGHSTPDGFSTHLTDDISSKKFITYIIKGGPGTGKSSMMKKIAAKMSEIEEPELYYCSSDPDSLDAVVLRSTGVIIVDGTSPHVFEPEYPGVSEILVDLGSCWNVHELAKNKENIIRTTVQNKKYHALVKRYLKAIISLNDDVVSISSACLYKAKLDAYCDRLSSRLFPKKKTGSANIYHRQITSITPKGVMTHKCNFDDLTVYKICDDYYAVADRLLSKLAYNAASCGYDVIVSENVFLRAEVLQHMIIPELKIAFVCDSGMVDFDVKINAMRFYDRFVLKEKRKRLNFDLGMVDKLTAEAVEALRVAKEIHDELESYYIGAMDFSKVDAVAEKLLKMIIEHNVQSIT